MNLFDLISFVFIIAFFLWGTKKGFIIEISEIGGLIISFILAMYIPLELNIGAIKYVVSFLAYFFIISIGFSVLSKIIHKTPLVFLDRLLGAAIGAIKGLIVVLIIFLIISLTPIKKTHTDLSNSLFYRTALIVRPPLKDFLQRRIKKIEQNKEKLPVFQKKKNLKKELTEIKNKI